MRKRLKWGFRVFLVLAVIFFGEIAYRYLHIKVENIDRIQVLTVTKPDRVLFRAESDTVWKFARRGRVIPTGVTLRVKRGGEVGIILAGYASMKLREGTELVIDRRVKNRKELRGNLGIRLREGEALLHIEKIGDNFDEEVFTVETPNSVAGVRGTEFIVRRRERMGSIVLLKEGIVEVTLKNPQKGSRVKRRVLTGPSKIIARNGRLTFAVLAKGDWERIRELERLESFETLELLRLLAKETWVAGLFDPGARVKDALAAIESFRRDRAVDIEMGNIARELKAYYLSTMKFPSSLELLQMENRLGQIDTMDPWGNDYKLELKVGPKAVIISAGPDGEFETEDDIFKVVDSRDF